MGQEIVYHTVKSAGRRHQQRDRQCLHRREGLCAAGKRRRRRQKPSADPGGQCAGGFHRRDRHAASDGQDRRRRIEWRRSFRDRAGRNSARKGDHDDGYPAKGGRCARLTIGGKTVTIGGMCKGSGMIHPNMCTMLCFLTTDAASLQGAAAGSPVRGCEGYLQYDFRGRGYLYERYGAAAGKRPGRKSRDHGENEDYQAFCGSSPRSVIRRWPKRSQETAKAPQRCLRSR